MPQTWKEQSSFIHVAPPLPQCELLPKSIGITDKISYSSPQPEFPLIESLAELANVAVEFTLRYQHLSYHTLAEIKSVDCT